MSSDSDIDLPSHLEETQNSTCNVDDSVVKSHDDFEMNKVDLKHVKSTKKLNVESSSTSHCVSDDQNNTSSELDSAISKKQGKHKTYREIHKKTRKTENSVVRENEKPTRQENKEVNKKKTVDSLEVKEAKQEKVKKQYAKEMKDSESSSSNSETELKMQSNKKSKKALTSEKEKEKNSSDDSDDESGISRELYSKDMQRIKNHKTKLSRRQKSAEKLNEGNGSDSSNENISGESNLEDTQKKQGSGKKYEESKSRIKQTETNDKNRNKNYKKNKNVLVEKKKEQKEAKAQFSPGSDYDSDENEVMLPNQTPSKTRDKNSNYQLDSDESSFKSHRRNDAANLKPSKKESQNANDTESSESSSEGEDAAKTKAHKNVSQKAYNTDRNERSSESKSAVKTKPTKKGSLGANDTDSDESSSEPVKHGEKRKSSQANIDKINDRSCSDQRSKKDKKRKDCSPEEKTVKQISKTDRSFIQENSNDDQDDDDSSDNNSYIKKSKKIPVKSSKTIIATSDKKIKYESDLNVLKKKNQEKPIKSTKEKEKSPKHNLSDEDLHTSSAGASARRKKKTEKSKEEKETQGANKPTRSKKSVEKEDSDKVKRTIKAKVVDVHKTKDTYVLYLEDPSINKGEFEEDTMLLDGLQKLLFVTFEHRKYAKAFCKITHDESSNIAEVVRASAGDFNIFNNILYIRCPSLKRKRDIEKVSKLVHSKTQLEIVKIVQYDEPSSAILFFPPELCRKETISKLTWDCCLEYENEKIITGPVYRNKMIIVNHLNKKTTDKTLQRFLTSKRYGGQPDSIDSLERVNDECAIVTFKTYEGLQSILKKGSYELEEAKLEIDQFYPCLKPESFNMSLTENKSEKSLHEDSSRSTGRSKIQTSEALKQDLDYCEINLLQQLHIFKDLEKNHSVELTLDIANKERSSILIKGNEKNAKDVQCKILEICRDKLRTEKIDLNLAPPSEDLLMFEDVQEKTNQLLQAKQISAFFAAFNNAFKVCYKKDEDVKQVCQLIQSQAEIKHMALDDERLGILQSPNGEKFLDELKKTDEKQTTSIIKVDGKQKFLLIVTRTEQMWQLVSSIEEFLNKNKIHTREIEIPYAKRAYINKFCKREYEKCLRKLQDSGTEVKCISNKIVLRGSLDQLEDGAKDLENLCDSLITEDTKLDFIGIQHFLSTNGAILIKHIEEMTECTIFEKNNEGNQNNACSDDIFIGPVPSVSTIASAQMQHCNVRFLQGNPLDIKVDAIMNIVDKNGNFLDELGKEIFLRGDNQIQREIKEQKRAWLNVIQTSAGEIKHIKEIYHIVLSEAESDLDTFADIVAKCLNQASKQIKSLTFSAAGILKNFAKFPMFTVCSKIMTALQMHISKNEHCISEIFMCDRNGDIVSELMARFTPQFKTDLQIVGSIKEEGTRGEHRRKSTKSKNTFKFGDIMLKCISGVITKSKTEAIVATIDKSLDLSKSKISQSVLKYGGNEIQEELTVKYGSNAPVSPGTFVETSGGKLHVQYIYHVVLPRWNTRNSAEFTKMVLDILKSADDKNLQNISFPALGIGGMKYPAEESGQAFIDAIKSFSDINKNLKSITWVLFERDQDTAEVFTQLLCDNEDNMDKSKQPEQGKQPTRTDDTNIELTVTSNQSDKVRQAIKKLQKSFKKTYINFSYNNKFVRNFNSEQIKSLQDTGLELGVYLTIDVKEDRVVIQGFSENKDAVLQQILHSVDELREKSFHLPLLNCKWQYENLGKWRDFKENINQQIEMEYSKHSIYCSVKDERGRTFRIDFKKMEEHFMKHGTAVVPGYPIRRIDLTKEPLPESWNGMRQDEPYKLVVLKADSPEFKLVSTLFAPTGKAILQIERVQNETIYRQYQREKENITKKNQPNLQNEMTLFFGAHFTTINLINANGFSPSNAGIHFYSNPASCVSGSNADSNKVCRMYQAKVLVGESVFCQDNIKSLPNKNGIPLCDSVTDSKGLFIVFNKIQAYPEYIISFSV